MSQTPWRTVRPAPILGEHNEEVYMGRLGFAKEDIAMLRGKGVI